MELWASFKWPYKSTTGVITTTNGIITTYFPLVGAHLVGEVNFWGAKKHKRFTHTKNNRRMSHFFGGVGLTSPVWGKRMVIQIFLLMIPKQNSLYTWMRCKKNKGFTQKTNGSKIPALGMYIQNPAKTLHLGQTTNYQLQLISRITHQQWLAMKVPFSGKFLKGLLPFFAIMATKWKFKVDTLPETNSHFCSQLSKNKAIIVCFKSKTFNFNRFCWRRKSQQTEGSSSNSDNLLINLTVPSFQKVNKKKRQKNGWNQDMKAFEWKNKSHWYDILITSLTHLNFKALRYLCDLKKTQFQPISTNQNLCLKKKQISLKSSSSNGPHLQIKRFHRIRCQRSFKLSHPNSAAQSTPWSQICSAQLSQPWEFPQGQADR